MEIWIDMCGIVGYTGLKAAAPILLEGLRRLEYRGYDSAGIAVLDDGLISVSKSAGKVATLCEHTADGRTRPGCIGIGHTRWATHGSPTNANAHPHLSNDGRFAVVHNGIIENYLSLREELVAKGYTFNSETDTEVVAHLLEMYYEGDFRAALERTCRRLTGSFALGVLCADEPRRICVARQSSPLIIGLGEGENYFASDVTALVAHTRDIIYLDDGEIAEITPDKVSVFSPSGERIEKEISHIWWDVQSAEKGGYEHFMLKEIFEQPTAIEKTLSPRIENGKITLEREGIDGEYLRSIRKIVITACGSSYYAGCAAKYAIERLAKIPTQVEYASELRYSDVIIDEGTLLIALSQSGETADTLAAMKECKALGARTVAIVNVVGSTISKLADHTLYTWAGPEIAVATTKGYTTQLAVLYAFALYTASVLDRVSDEEYVRLAEKLHELPKLAERALETAPHVEEVGRRYDSHNSMFFIGRNTDFATSLEAALKMKELSYIHAESYAAGELKHGTIALIDEGQPVVALCCNDAVMEKTMSNIVEVRARGARVLGVAFEDNEKIGALTDDIIRIPRTEAIFAPMIEVIPMQLLSYYVARDRGCDIDKPKNLAKSVTVE